MEIFYYLGTLILGVGVGYVLRKYTTTKYPEEVALLDAVATKYGTKAKDEIQSVIEDMKK